MRAAPGVSTKLLTGIPEGDPGSFQYTESVQYSTVRYGKVRRRRAEIEKNMLKLGVLKYLRGPVEQIVFIHWIAHRSKRLVCPSAELKINGSSSAGPVLFRHQAQGSSVFRR